MLLAAGLSTTLVMVVWHVWTQSARQTARLSSGGAQMQEIRLRAKRMMNELQEGLALLYPLPGGPTQSGISFLNARGQVVLYHEAPSESGTGRSILRIDLTSEAGDERSEEVVKDIAWFRATVLPAARGLEPSCVTLEVCLTGTGPSGETTGQHSAVTTVFLRGIERDIPE